MKKLKLGVIGLSEGNGHPYSWSAIFNGYNAEAMESCPFPVIPLYLKKQKFPEDTIKDAQVTHIWTQDIKLSQHIAKASNVENIVENMEAMIPDIDAVLLARDDATNHFKMAKPFLEAGLPIYIDKPLALTRAHAEALFSLQQYPGQIFTCSAFQYAHELPQINPNIIIHIKAYIKNDWNKYAIHLIEPILKLIGHQHAIINTSCIRSDSLKIVNFLFQNGTTAQIKTFSTLNVSPTLNIFTPDGELKIIFSDTFHAFKNALRHFVRGVQEKKEVINRTFVMRSIEMIEKGNSINLNSPNCPTTID